MNNYVKILLIVIFLSSCSTVDPSKYSLNFLEKIHLNQHILNKNYFGMTKNQIVYIFGIPIISDSFSDVYHYCLYDSKNDDFFQKKMLNLYFKDNKVLKFTIT
ncbi:MAG: outer membrane protein assembly factor BamE [Buchnera aphidicola (Microlophium carnosum)]|uniref:Outer membrane protein assembly factor BamE n=1 Tax=Buchnera aphidicola (Microlophium carnosum) TaxID=2708354 RepID=A0A6G9JTS3_9GAMM|nr:MAG: outer membrane protein assembly factor BamE [Buchnera aphidicola (Microlophium carnosum)]